MNLLSFYDSNLSIPFSSASFSQSTGQWTPLTSLLAALATLGLITDTATP